MPGQPGTRRLVAPVAALLVAGATAALILGLSGGSKLPRIPPAGFMAPSTAGPLGYNPSRTAQFVARATAGEAHVLYTKTPGGAVATAAREARFGSLINQVTAGTGVAPATLEGIVFLESAGDPQAIAGGDPGERVRLGVGLVLVEHGDVL